MDIGTNMFYRGDAVTSKRIPLAGLCEKNPPVTMVSFTKDQ